MGKRAIKYGVIVGLASFVWLLAEYYLGFRTDRFDVHLKTSLFSIILLIGGIVAAMYVSRSERGSKYGFKQGFVTGLLVSLVAGVVMMGGQYLYLSVIDDDYLNRAKAWSTYIQVLDGTDLETARSNTANDRLKNSVHAHALGQIPIFLLRGAVISLIAAPIITRKRA